MAQERQRPLEEVIFGARLEEPAKSDGDLASAISAWYREARARAGCGETPKDPPPPGQARGRGADR